MGGLGIVERCDACFIRRHLDSIMKHMTNLDIIIPATERSPDLILRASMPYAHYQWLRAMADGMPENVPSAIREEVQAFGTAASGIGPAGIWAAWESAIADHSEPTTATESLGLAIDRTRDQLVNALNATTGWFATNVWPSDLEAVQDAVDVLVNEPRIPDLFAEQAEVLGLTWPSPINVNLVARTYSFAGAYSHPLTIDVTNTEYLMVHDMLLHESTHVADAFSTAVGPCEAGDGLRERLVARGFSRRTAFDRWHAMIFASCRARIRRTIDPAYEGLPSGSRPFRFMGVPDPYPIWDRFEFEGRDIDRLAEDLTATS